MWRTYNDSGTLAYSFIDSLVAMHPYYIARTVGGLFFLAGAVVASWNVWMTIRMARLDQPEEGGADVPLYGKADAVQAGE
jgi:cytochrome c oxidase cbb3-type subunit 1